MTTQDKTQSFVQSALAAEREQWTGPSAIDNGGPAFPTSNPNYEQRYAGEGMTLRDYFAAKALPSIVAIVSAGQHQPPPTHGHGADRVQWMADEAYRLADAMLAARSAS